MPKPTRYCGRWRIIQMDGWDQDFVDMEVEGYFLFGPDLSGTFQFGLVYGELSYGIAQSKYGSRLRFLWTGEDENDPASGSGWAVLTDGGMSGSISIRGADSSGFKALNIPLASGRARRSSRSKAYRPAESYEHPEQKRRV